jgi:hypothetical protein
MRSTSVLSGGCAWVCMTSTGYPQICPDQQNRAPDVTGRTYVRFMKPHATPHLHTGPDTLPPGGSARRHPAGPAVPEGGTTGGFTSRTAARLAEAAGLAESRDRLMGRLVRLLIEVKGAEDLAEVTGGMSLHVWLQHEGRATHAEARDLLGAADVLVHMPATVAGLCDRWLSWPQTIAIARAAKRVPVRLRAELDQLVADAMTTHADWEPDALVHDVWQWIDAHQPTRLQKQQQAADRGEFVTLTPGCGAAGPCSANWAPSALPPWPKHSTHPLGPPVTPPDDLDDHDAVEEALDALEAQRQTLTRHHGRRLARQLVSLCEHALAGHRPTDGAGRARQQRGRWHRHERPAPPPGRGRCCWPPSDWTPCSTGRHPGLAAAHPDRRPHEDRHPHPPTARQ